MMHGHTYIISTSNWQLRNYSEQETSQNAFEDGGGEGKYAKRNKGNVSGKLQISTSYMERFSAPVQTGPGTHQPPIQWVPGLSWG